MLQVSQAFAPGTVGSEPISGGADVANGKVYGSPSAKEGRTIGRPDPIVSRGLAKRRFSVMCVVFGSLQQVGLP